MSNKYMDFTPNGTIERYLVNTKGDIYKCTLITFKEFSDSYYCELPTGEITNSPTLIENFPYGWWSACSCYETIEEAKKQAIDAKLILIRNTEDKIEELREEIHELEKEIITHQDDVVYLSNNTPIVYDATDSNANKD